MMANGADVHNPAAGGTGITSPLSAGPGSAHAAAGTPLLRTGAVASMPSTTPATASSGTGNAPDPTPHDPTPLLVLLWRVVGGVGIVFLLDTGSRRLRGGRQEINTAAAFAAAASAAGGSSAASSPAGVSTAVSPLDLHLRAAAVNSQALAQCGGDMDAEAGDDDNIALARLHQGALLPLLAEALKLSRDAAPAPKAILMHLDVVHEVAETLCPGGGRFLCPIDTPMARRLLKARGLVG
jgi:hypothetical protein